MNREMSVYLDGVRFLAALAVFFSHIGTRYYSDGFLWPAVALGAPAVVIFFVLSGFVIGFVADGREITGRDYSVARAARIYSVVVPTLILTAILDWFGSLIDPAGYKDVVQMIGAGAWYIPASLTFLHMAWGGGARIFAGSDGAYWSLGYEVIYYVIFGFAFYGRGVVRIIGCIVTGAVAGPHILGLFPVWLLGLAAYHVSRRAYVSRSVGGIGVITSAIAMIVYIDLSKTSVDLADHGIWEIAQDYVLAIIFAVNLVSFRAISDWFRPVQLHLGRQIRWLAGATFTLYLLHVPLLMFIRSASVWPLTAWQYRVILVGGSLGVVFLVAQFTERKKEPWRAAFDWLLTPFPV